MGLPRLHNHVSQSFTIHLFLYTYRYPTGSVSLKNPDYTLARKTNVVNSVVTFLQYDKQQKSHTEHILCGRGALTALTAPVPKERQMQTPRIPGG